MSKSRNVQVLAKELQWLSNVINTRFAEKLRHKNRALAQWDQRLILEKFKELKQIAGLTQYEQP